MKPAIITLMVLLTATASIADTLQQRPANGRIIVRYHDTPTPARILQHIKTGATYRGANFSGQAAEDISFDVASSSNASNLQEENDLAQQIARDPQVDFAEPDYVMQILGTSQPPALSGTPNDSYYSQQWYLYERYGINAPDMWSQMDTSGVVNVAVIDSGFLIDHPDIKDILLDGMDVIANPFRSKDGDGRDYDPSDSGTWEVAGQCGSNGHGEPIPPVEIDSSWHGSHVGTTIAATTNNSHGIAGVTYNQARLIGIRAVSACGASTFEVAVAIVLAAGLAVEGFPIPQTKAKVINISLGGFAPACPEILEIAISWARKEGAIIVAAAGNDAVRAEHTAPGNCEGVLTVAATNRAGDKAYYSNYGSNVDIAAPGGETKVFSAATELADTPAKDSTALTILPYTNDPFQTTISLENGIIAASNSGAQNPQQHSYAYYQGTSMAAPLVSGALASLALVLPNLTLEQAREILQRTAQPFPQGGSLPCTPESCGAGILDAGAAYRLAKEMAAGL